MTTTITMKPAKTLERKTTRNRRTAAPRKITKIDQLIALLTRPDGASITEMCKNNRLAKTLGARCNGWRHPEEWV